MVSTTHTNGSIQKATDTARPAKRIVLMTRIAMPFIERTVPKVLVTGYHTKRTVLMTTVITSHLYGSVQKVQDFC